MNIEQFTEKAREAMLQASSLAQQRNNAQIEVIHLLAALLHVRVYGIVQRLAADRRASRLRWL